MVPGIVYETISIAAQEVLIIGQPSLQLLLKVSQGWVVRQLWHLH
jgi:hypothetical protein